MLENLDLINWEDLSPPFFGSGSEIPQVIRNLTSSVPSIRRDAIGELYERLWHQGTVCEVTIYAVPFLIELLAESSVEDKDNIAIFLSNITYADPWGYAHPAAAFFQKRLDIDTSEFLNGWFARVRYEVQKGCPIYNRLLKQESPILRRVATYLLGLFADCAEQNIHWLKLQFASEENDVVRAAIIFSVGLLSSDRSEDIAWLQNIFDTENDSFLRINAAIALCKSTPDNVSESVIDLLIGAIANPNDVSFMFDRFPWKNNRSEYGIPQYWCSIALASTGTRSQRLLPKLISVLETVSPDGSYDIAGCILTLVFNGRAMSPTLTAYRLSHEQRLGLEAIANSKQFWSGFAENCVVYHTAELLKSFGVPIKPEKLKAFLAGELSLSDAYEDIPF